VIGLRTVDPDCVLILAVTDGVTLDDVRRASSGF
jgi:hypothetical protein